MKAIKLGLAGLAVPGVAWGHAGEGGFVLLLPTDLYIGAGTLSVALTVILLAVLPARAAAGAFQPLALVRLPRLGLRYATSLLAFALCVFLVWAGLNGPRDPLTNPLPLFTWTVWWVGLITLQGVLGDHWRWTNPWTGPAAVIGGLLGGRAPLRYPRALGHVPAVIGFLGFYAILLADPAPTDPARLAYYAGGYWVFHFTGLLLFGPVWLVRAEAVTVLMRAYARVALLGRARGGLGLGLNGWRVFHGPPVPTGLAVFMILMLGAGSFDGLNETFWWFAQIGINPLEFPGRSEVVAQNLTGLLAANLALVAIFAGSVWLGGRLAGQEGGFGAAFRLFAPSLLPIALGYHLAHYLTSFLVDGQYALAALSDPLARGGDLLGLGTFYVSTGFLFTQDTVRLIFLAQAGAVVVGHILAILLAHALAVRAYGSSVRAALSQAPLAAFMVAYTLFGLWLLASPRGV